MYLKPVGFKNERNFKNLFLSILSSIWHLELSQVRIFTLYNNLAVCLEKMGMVCELHSETT